jgi:hypothetical protein
MTVIPFEKRQRDSRPLTPQEEEWIESELHFEEARYASRWMCIFALASIIIGAASYARGLSILFGISCFILGAMIAVWKRWRIALPEHVRDRRRKELEREALTIVQIDPAEPYEPPPAA